MKMKFTLVSLWSALVLLPVASAHAENACKGLPQQTCDGAEQCLWVNGYTRKDGREVASYCRVKSTGKTDNVSGKAPRRPPAS